MRDNFFMQKHLIFFSTLIFVGIASLPSYATNVTAISLLQSSDRARGGFLKGLLWNVTLNSVEDGTQSTRSFEVKAKDADALVTATAPPRNRGEIFLFNNHDLWFVKPGLRKPISISSRERLSGQAANGDIASTNYTRDYKGEVEGNSKVGDQAVYVLKLKAKDSKVTYDQIRYYIAQKSKLALRADFLSLQGDLMKTATFEYKNHITVDGKAFPFISKMTIVDAKMKNNSSEINYSNPVEKDFPASIFNVNNVSR
jgi:hypothetical protein